MSERNKAVIRQALERDGYSCRKCGFGLRLEVAHIVDLYIGGTDTVDNTITLCHGCHVGEPHAKTPEETKRLKLAYYTDRSCPTDKVFENFIAKLTEEERAQLEESIARLAWRTVA